MISKLHYITQDVNRFSHAELAEFACKGGADWIQLRVKGKSYNDWLQIAQETRTICNKHKAKLIINDNVQIAKEIGADGVHLGKKDMNPNEARKILGNNFIIGGSSNTMDDVNWLIANGIDYIGVGPFRYTTTKEKVNPILGLKGIKNIIRTLSPFGKGSWVGLPVIAVGGIKLKDVESLMQTGIHGVAVSSAINLAEDKSAVVRKFITAIKEKDPLTPLRMTFSN